MTYEPINPPELPPPRGWTHGMLAPADGCLLFVAGQTAAWADGSVPAGDFAAQFEVALEKVLAVVRAAGGEPQDIGRMTVYVTSMGAYTRARKDLKDVWMRHLGRHYPAMALVEVSALVDVGARVEIEATAVIPRGPRRRAEGTG